MRVSKLFAFFCCLLTAVALFAAFDAAEAAGDPKFKFKLGHVLTPGTSHHVASTKLAELVSERSNGEIVIDVFPSSQLGDEREMIEAVQLGTLDFVFTATAPLTAWVPSFLVFDIPFLLDGYDHAYRVYDGEFGADRMVELAKLGIIGLGITEAGFSNIINNGKPINVPDDSKGMNLRCMESPGLIAYFKAMGANPVPMAMSEVFTAMQNGTVDGGTWPLATSYFNKLYTITKYCTLLDPIPTTCLLAASEATWNKLSPQQQEIIRTASKDAIDFQRNYLADLVQKLVKDMEADGMQFVYPDRQVWKDALYDKVIADMVPKYVSMELIEKVRSAAK